MSVSYARSVRRRVQTDPGSVSMTKQSFKKECDINNILSQFQKTGIITHISKNANNGEYIDLPTDLDFQNSINIVLAAQESFATLPSIVRDHFKNDPGLFLAAFQDPAQRERLQEWGILKKPPVPAGGTQEQPAPDKAPAS